MRFISPATGPGSNGKQFESGELVKGEFKHRCPGFQSYVLNLRNPKLQDVRVRRRWAWRSTTSG
jgi:ABC-type oligopeptide transport system substrate-binding subunit